MFAGDGWSQAQAAGSAALQAPSAKVSAVAARFDSKGIKTEALHGLFAPPDKPVREGGRPRRP
jgi:hypothetical protein